MKKKIILTLLIAAQLSTLACVDTTNGGSETTADDSDAVSTSVKEEEDVISDDLPEKDFGGEKITFFVRSNGKDSVDLEEISGDIVEDAIYDRNRLVEQRFGVEIEVLEAEDAMCKSAKDTILAGDDSYDVVAAHARGLTQLAANGVFLEWNEYLPYINLDKPWWSQDARDSFEVCGKIYFCSGDLFTNNLGSTYGMFYNKDIFEKLKIENIYETVNNGEWTFDLFQTYAKQGSDDLNGDGSYTIDKDQFGYATTWWGGPIEVLYTGGQRICRKNEEDELILTLNTERTIDIFEKFFSFADEECAYILEKDDGAEVETAFKENRLMFRDAPIQAMFNLRDMNVDFGVIPWPKYDENMDKYYSNVDASCTLFGFPITLSDEHAEMISIVIEALSAESYKSVIPKYYEDCLQVKFSRDDESVKMLDLIRDGRVFDMGYYHGDCVFSLNSIGYWLVRNGGDHSFVSHYASHESEGLARLDDINEFYRGE